MNGGSGADFMYMWTQILEGGGNGEDFDFFYFTGPTDFGKYFAPRRPGRSPERLEAWFDARVARDPAFRKAVDQGDVTESQLSKLLWTARLRSAQRYSSHDQSDASRARSMRGVAGAADFGIASQLAIFFDGQPQSPRRI